MTPLLRAQQWYEHYIPNGNFGAELADFMVVPSNVAIVRPDVFLMAEQVRWDNEAKQIIEGEPNAWYVRLAAVGDGVAWWQLFETVPWRHEFVLWQRRNDGNLRARRHESLKKKGN